MVGLPRLVFGLIYSSGRSSCVSGSMKIASNSEPRMFNESFGSSEMPLIALESRETARPAAILAQ